MFYKIYQNLKKNLIYVEFNLKFKSQLYISQALKLINCLVNNFYELKKKLIVWIINIKLI